MGGKKMKTFTEKKEAITFKNFKNNSLSQKCFHKYFKVVVDGPEDNYAVIDYREAREMGLSILSF
jgi:hypothetical protein